MIYDYIVIGSGFGGSVASLRLVEKGYKVLLLEQGRRYNPDVSVTGISNQLIVLEDEWKKKRSA